MNDVWETIRSMRDEMREEIASLKARVAELENVIQRDQDAREYAEHGSRYGGTHLRSCACDRCLQSEFGSWNK